MTYNYALMTHFVSEDPRAIWHTLPSFIEGVEYTQQVAEHFSSFNFVSAIEVTLCPGEMNDLAFMDATPFLKQLWDNAIVCALTGSLYPLSTLCDFRTIIFGWKHTTVLCRHLTTGLLEDSKGFARKP